MPIEKGVTMTRNKPARESNKPKMQMQFYENLQLQRMQTLEVWGYSNFKLSHSFLLCPARARLGKVFIFLE